MKYVKLTLNFLIKLTFLFLFFATWISLYSKNMVLNFSVAGILTIIGLIVWHLISKKHLTKKNLKQGEKDKLEKTINNLRCLSKTKQTEFLKKVCESTSALIYVNLNKLAEGDFYEIMQKASAQNKSSVFAFCLETDAKFDVLASSQENATINVVDKLEIYKLCAQKNIFPPEILKQKSKAKITFKILIKNIFNEKRAKQYFMFAAFTLLFSLFTIFKTYYLICATIFLGLSIACFIEHKEKTKKVADK